MRRPSIIAVSSMRLLVVLGIGAVLLRRARVHALDAYRAPASGAGVAAA